MSFKINGFDIEETSEDYVDTELGIGDTSEEEVDLNSLTVIELRTIAKEKGITGYSSMAKQQLIDAIKETP